MNTKKSLIQRYAAFPYIVWSVLFIVVPLIFVLYYAFTDSNGNFSFHYIARIFDADMVKVFLTSMSLAFISTIFCLIIAYPVAYFITKAPKNAQTILLLLSLLPMWLNFVLRTYALSVILDDGGIINNILGLLNLGQIKMINTSGAVIIGMIYNFIPYMLLPIYTVMSKMDKSLIEASEDLGCNRFQTLTRVIMPMSLPGVVSGITMVFVPCVSTFYISQKLGPTDFTLVGDVIESYITNSGGVYNYASAISLVLMVLILICLAVMNRFSDDESTGGILP